MGTLIKSLLVLSLLVAIPMGCARTGDRSIYGTNRTSQPLTPAELRLREDAKIYNETILGGAATGAVKGAVLGLLFGLASGGNINAALKGAAIGAGGGAVFGGLDGWRVARQQEAARRQVREIEVVVEEVERENQRIRRSLANTDAVIADTRRSLREARAGYRANQTSLADVRRREARAENNIRQLDELIEGLEERNDDYAKISRNIRGDGQNTAELDRKIDDTRREIDRLRRERDLLEQELEQGRIA
ncbi:MAG: hypothetical protein AAF713_09375 [Pseudomonadota bacterium]